MIPPFLTHVIRAVPIITFVALSITFYAYSPRGAIELLGVSNSYLLLFVLAFFGGLTTFSGVPYHFVLITLATGGLNPWLLGLAAASGVMVGDSTSFYIGYQGKFLLPHKIERILDHLSHLYLRHPRLLPFFFLGYGAIVPLSNDVITIPMGLLHYPFWQVMVPLAIGNLFFNVSLALGADYAYQFLEAII